MGEYIRDSFTFDHADWDLESDHEQEHPISGSEQGRPAGAAICPASPITEGRLRCLSPNASVEHAFESPVRTPLRSVSRKVSDSWCRENDSSMPMQANNRCNSSGALPEVAPSNCDPEPLGSCSHHRRQATIIRCNILNKESTITMTPHKASKMPRRKSRTGSDSLADIGNDSSHSRRTPIRRLSEFLATARAEGASPNISHLEINLDEPTTTVNGEILLRSTTAPTANSTKDQLRRKSFSAAHSGSNLSEDRNVPAGRKIMSTTAVPCDESSSCHAGSKSTEATEDETDASQEGEIDFGLKESFNQTVPRRKSMSAVLTGESSEDSQGNHANHALRRKSPSKAPPEIIEDGQPKSSKKNDAEPINETVPRRRSMSAALAAECSDDSQENHANRAPRRKSLSAAGASVDITEYALPKKSKKKSKKNDSEPINETAPRRKSMSAALRDECSEFSQEMHAPRRKSLSAAEASIEITEDALPKCSKKKSKKKDLEEHDKSANNRRRKSLTQSSTEAEEQWEPKQPRRKSLSACERKSLSVADNADVAQERMSRLQGSEEAGDVGLKPRRRKSLSAENSNSESDVPKQRRRKSLSAATGSIDARHHIIDVKTEVTDGTVRILIEAEKQLRKSKLNESNEAVVVKTHRRKSASSSDKDGDMDGKKEKSRKSKSTKKSKKMIKIGSISESSLDPEQIIEFSAQLLQKRVSDRLSSPLMSTATLRNPGEELSSLKEVALDQCSTAATMDSFSESAIDPLRIVATSPRPERSLKYRPHELRSILSPIDSREAVIFTKALSGIQLQRQANATMDDNIENHKKASMSERASPSEDVVGERADHGGTTAHLITGIIKATVETTRSKSSANRVSRKMKDMTPKELSIVVDSTGRNREECGSSDEQESPELSPFLRSFCISGRTEGFHFQRYDDESVHDAKASSRHSSASAGNSKLPDLTAACEREDDRTSSQRKQGTSELSAPSVGEPGVGDARQLGCSSRQTLRDSNPAAVMIKHHVRCERGLITTPKRTKAVVSIDKPIQNNQHKVGSLMKNGIDNLEGRGVPLQAGKALQTPMERQATNKEELRVVEKAKPEKVTQENSEAYDEMEEFQKVFASGGRVAGWHFRDALSKELSRRSLNRGEAPASADRPGENPFLQGPGPVKRAVQGRLGNPSTTSEQVSSSRDRYGRPAIRRTPSTRGNVKFADRLKAFQK